LFSKILSAEENYDKAIEKYEECLENLDVIDPKSEKHLALRLHIMENLSNSFYYKA